MIGALGLSLGGLAAVAGVPATNGVSCAGTPTHAVARVSEPPALPTPAPKPSDLPTPAFALLELPAAPSLPVPATIPYPIPVPAPTPSPSPSPSPSPRPTLPQIDMPASPPPIPQVLPSVPAEAPRRIEPLAEPLKSIELPKLTAPTPVPQAATKLPVNETPAFTLEALSPVNATPVPAPVPTPAPTPVEAAKVAERKLKVILAMGDERPRFEVRDGDEVYLKVVCDRVEVKSPGEGGASVSTMSATGKVTFVTPGGEGTCDQLAVLPGTGQVVVTGKVTFTYNWGKVETTVTGEKMNFRLGSNTVTPTASQGTTGVTGVPTSFSRTR